MASQHRYLRALRLATGVFAAAAALGLVRPPARGDGPATLRLATFNIHHGEGADGLLDLERIADQAREADVAAFQEVDVRFGERSRFEDQAARLGKLLGGAYVFGGNLVEGDRRYGVALVSKFPIVASRNHPLPHAPGREKAEPRGVLEATLDVRGLRVRVFVTHFAHDSADDRRLQVDAVRRHVASNPGPAIVMGDLNFRPDHDAYARLLAPHGESTAPLLVDAWPRVGRGPGATIGLDGAAPARIDYILVTPDLAPGLKSARVAAETRASDHQPLMVVIEPPAAP